MRPCRIRYRYAHTELFHLLVFITETPGDSQQTKRPVTWDTASQAISNNTATINARLLVKKAHSHVKLKKKNIVYATIQAEGLVLIKSKNNSDRDHEFPFCLEG